jgi:hypothetical protein
MSPSSAPDLRIALREVSSPLPFALILLPESESFSRFRQRGGAELRWALSFEIFTSKTTNLYVRRGATFLLPLPRAHRHTTFLRYLYSLAEYRSPNSPLLIMPLLHLGSVGVLTSVPVALVIKRAGYTHKYKTQLRRNAPHDRAADSATLRNTYTVDRNSCALVCSLAPRAATTARMIAAAVAIILAAGNQTHCTQTVLPKTSFPAAICSDPQRPQRPRIPPNPTSPFY